MQYDTITTQEQLEELCDRLAGSSYIGFDTEFISERAYRPELCLVQIAAEGFVGAGSTVTRPVGEKELAVSRAKQRNISGWKRPEKKNKD